MKSEKSFADYRVSVDIPLRFGELIAISSLCVDFRLEKSEAKSMISEDEEFEDDSGEYEIISVNPNVNYESEDESNDKVETSTSTAAVKVAEIIASPLNDDNNSNSSDVLVKERKRLKLEDYKKRRANIKDEHKETLPLFDLPRRIAVELCDIPSLPPLMLPTDPEECAKLARMAEMPRTNPRDEAYRMDTLNFNPDKYEEIVLVSTGSNTEVTISPTDESRNGGGKTLLNDIVRENKDELMLTSSMSLFSSIQAVVVQGSKELNEQKRDKFEEKEHGEDKIIMHLSKNRLKPFSCSIAIQTDSHPLFPPLLVSSSINSKPIRNFRRKVSRSRSRSRSFSPEYDRKFSRYARSQHSTHSSSMYSSMSSSDSDDSSDSGSDSSYSSERSSSESLRQFSQRDNFKFYNRNQRTDAGSYKEYRGEFEVDFFLGLKLNYIFV